MGLRGFLLTVALAYILEETVSSPHTHSAERFRRGRGPQMT